METFFKRINNVSPRLALFSVSSKGYSLAGSFLFFPPSTPLAFFEPSGVHIDWGPFFRAPVPHPFLLPQFRGLSFCLHPGKVPLPPPAQTYLLCLVRRALQTLMDRTTVVFSDPHWSKSLRLFPRFFSFPGPRRHLALGNLLSLSWSCVFRTIPPFLQVQLIPQLLEYSRVVVIFFRGKWVLLFFPPPDRF